MAAQKKTVEWDAKPRTSLRRIKPGDTFLFRLSAERYGVGRIVSTVSLGHVAEFFDIVVEQPELDAVPPSDKRRKGRLVILDSYSLFDRKSEGDWRIVSHDDTFEPENVEGVYFTYGDGASRKRVDVFDNEAPISESAAKKLPPYAPFGDEDVKRELYPDYAGTK